MIVSSAEAVSGDDGVVIMVIGRGDSILLLQAPLLSEYPSIVTTM